MDWDVFISHAWEDKEAFARPLAKALEEKGLLVWYDEFTLRVGDSLRRSSIDHGLANSRYGVVILSPNFFAKDLGFRVAVTPAEQRMGADEAMHKAERFLNRHLGHLLAAGTPQ